MASNISEFKKTALIRAQGYNKGGLKGGNGFI